MSNSAADVFVPFLLGGMVGAGFVYATGVIERLQKPLQHELTWGGLREGVQRQRSQLRGTGGPEVDLLGAYVAGVAGDSRLGSNQLEAARWATVDTLGDAIAAAPGSYAHYVQAFGMLMHDAGEQLAHMRELVGILGRDAQRYGEGSPQFAAARAWGQRYAAFAKRYQELSEGFWKYAQVVPPGQNLGASPVVIVAVVAGVGVSVAAIAWTVVTWRETQVLRDEIALDAQELQARVNAAAGGYTLPESTRSRPEADGFPWGLAAAGVAGLGLLTLAGAAYARGR